MNTPAHIVVNLVILGRRDRPRETAAIVAGAVLPDLPMLVFYFYERVVLKVPEAFIWTQDYHKPAWQAFFDVFNSLPFLLVAAGICYSKGARLPFLVFASMLLHILGDAPFHHDDAHHHLFPLSDWTFQSPISYWDLDHYGGVVAPLEVILFSFCCVVLARRATSPSARLLIAFVAVLYVVYWGYVFLVWA